MAVFAGVDLGATYVRAVIGDAENDELGMHKRPTPQGPSGIEVTEAVLGALRRACEEAAIDPTDLDGVGIGSIGPLDRAEGVIENPANLPDTIDRIPLTGPIENLADTNRVYLHNDAVAGVIGERFYSDRNPDNMAYLTISTGIGAGVCVDGTVLHGWDGNAGEVGHQTIDPDGVMTCGCGRDGHWEAYCSGDNIPRYARTLYEREDWQTDLPLHNEEFTAADVFAMSGEDAFADYLINRIALWNAIGVSSMVTAYAPLVIYIGGAVAINNPDLVVEPIRQKMEEMVFVNVPEIEMTQLGDDVVLKGALASARTGGTGDRSRLESVTV